MSLNKSREGELKLYSQNNLGLNQESPSAQKRAKGLFAKNSAATYSPT